MQHQLLVALLLWLLPLCAHAQNGQLAAMRNTVPESYNFWLYAPREYTHEHQKVPVIIFLHGASLCGNNLQRVRRYGLLHAIEKGRYYPCMVVAPQNPGGSWSPRKIAKILDWVEDNYDIDTTRVYAIGGGSTLKDYTKLGQVPLWMLHGSADRAVRISQSKQVVKAMQDAGNDKLLRYDWLPGASHGDLARILYLKQTYDWLFAHCLKDKPRDIDCLVPITMADMRSAYDYLTPEETKFDIVDQVKRK